MNYNCPWGFERFLDQEPDDASLTMSSKETKAFRNGECSLQTHGIIVVVDPHEMYASSIVPFQSERWCTEEVEVSLVSLPVNENRTG